MNEFRRARPGMLRAGISLVEVSAALLILGVAVVSVAQLVALAAAQRRDASRRQLASWETANTLDRISARSWEELNSERLMDLTLSERARQSLPGARLRVDVALVPGQPAAKRITVEVGWTTRSGQMAFARLVAWRHAGKELQP